MSFILELTIFSCCINYEMSECKQLITEWLNEYASLQDNEIKSFAAEHEHNHEIATAIFNLLYSDDKDEFYDQVLIYIVTFSHNRDLN